MIGNLAAFANPVKSSRSPRTSSCHHADACWLGMWHVISGTVHPVVPVTDAAPSTSQPLTLFLLLTAFSNGCTAMTGVEAVSNGVPAFQPPESKNAAATMVTMASRCWPCDVPRDHDARAGVPRHAHRTETVALAARARRVRRSRRCLLHRAGGDDGDPGAGGEHRVRGVPAAGVDSRARRFLPRQLMNQGDRLAFSNGIVGLSLFAAVLLIALRRRHARADSALHDRRLRVVHALAGRHGHALAAAAQPRAGAPTRSSTASARS